MRKATLDISVGGGEGRGWGGGERGKGEGGEGVGQKEKFIFGEERSGIYFIFAVLVLVPFVNFRLCR